MLDDGLKGLVGHPPQPGEDHVGKARHTCARVLAAVPAGEGGDQLFICCEAGDTGDTGDNEDVELRETC